MLNPLQKLILIPALTFGVGLFFTFHFSKSISVSSAYPEHLTGAFTGGFGEKTCHSCHFDYDLNWEEGSLSLSGLPEKIEAKTVYELEIEVIRPELGKAGFQLSARFPNGSQAGAFDISGNERLMFTAQVPDSLQYIQHSPKGTETTSGNSNIWNVRWKSPASISDSIIFNIAANAANGDESEFGDWIYVKEIAVK